MDADSEQNMEHGTEDNGVKCVYYVVLDKEADDETMTWSREGV
jgi:hypothetical protein